MPALSQKLIRWYRQHGRHDLPWQHNPTPYRVWVSEIMLQQTQVTTVIPYYQRFMKSFPTIKALALADEDLVLSHWSGLGYYARARNLHKTAKIIHQDLQGRFPKTIEGLVDLPGIGRSTAGAILSFAHHLPTAILDGNVKRVLARHFAVPGWYGKTEVANQLWAISERETPKKNTHEYNQAMMDLGATLCTRSTPDCSRCPLSNTCDAYQMDQVKTFPGKKPKKAKPFKQTRMIILQANDHLWLEKRPSKGIWGGLYSFPECDISNDLKQYCQSTWQLTQFQHDTLDLLTHQFTHFTLEIHPTVIQLHKPPPIENNSGIWYNTTQPLPGGIATPVNKILKRIHERIL